MAPADEAISSRRLESLAEAERMAVGALAESERQVQLLMANARRSASATAEQASRDSIAEIFRSRHDELLAILGECRDRLRAVVEFAECGWAEPVRADPPGQVQRHAVPNRPPVRHDGPHLHASRPILVADEQYLAALYRALDGETPRPAEATRPG